MLDPLLVPLFPPDVPLLVPLLDEFAPLGLLVPLLLDDPALFAPEVPELVPLFAPELRSELVPLFVRVPLVSLELDPVLLLLGRVVGSLLVVPELFVRLRVFVPGSLLSQPINAIPPSANAAATRIP